MNHLFNALDRLKKSAHQDQMLIIPEVVSECKRYVDAYARIEAARADLVAENERLKREVIGLDDVARSNLTHWNEAAATCVELRDQLTATRTALADMEKQRDYWIEDRKALQFADDAKIAELSTALAAAELRETKLHGWIEQWCKFDSLNMDLKKWLSFSAEYRAFQRDDSALREMIAGVYEECANNIDERKEQNCNSLLRSWLTRLAGDFRALAEKAKGECK